MKEKLPTWIIVAHETQAKIFTVHEKEVTCIHNLTHAASRLQDHEMLSARPGRYTTPGAGSKQGMLAPHADQHKLEQQIFARELASFLEKARTDHAYQHLILCAEPHFYGVLKKEFTQAVEGCIKEHILKDYLPLPEHELDGILQKIHVVH